MASLIEDTPVVIPKFKYTMFSKLNTPFTKEELDETGAKGLELISATVSGTSWLTFVYYFRDHRT